MKKPANLKKRFDELRDEPETMVDVVLHLDAELYQTLKKLAAKAQLSLEAYVVQTLSRCIETTDIEEEG